jgi:sulfur-oxidizing protein SoxB
MVRVGGMSYVCRPGAKIGGRIGDMRLRGRPIDADKLYGVASWAPVAEGAPNESAGEAIWEVVSRYLRDKKIVKPRKLNVPHLVGVSGNLGIA